MGAIRTILEHGNQHRKTENRNPGTVYLIGAGPGDPGLITVKALEKIRTADVIIYDYLADERLIREAKAYSRINLCGENREQAHARAIQDQRTARSKRLWKAKVWRG